MILSAIYFTLPAYFSNMAPVICKDIPFLNIPINEKLFGSHKTYRGIFFGTLFGIIIAFLQRFLIDFKFINQISIANYNNWLLIGFLLGFGAMIGDLIKSFFKRKLNIPPGDKFIPFDQIDFIVISFLLILPFYNLIIAKNISFLILFLYTLIISFFLHIIVNHIAFYLRIGKEKW